MSFSRDPQKLEALAAEIGGRPARRPKRRVRRGRDALGLVDAHRRRPRQAGSLERKIVIDTTNQFGRDGWEDLGGGPRQVNAARMPGARYTKAFNTLTSGFQAQAAGRTGPDRVVMFLCGDDEEAKGVVAGLIDDAGFTPVDMGGIADGADGGAAARRGLRRGGPRAGGARLRRRAAVVMTPTLYEWAGGAEALDRLTEGFYRRVHDDPILSPVFAGMSPDHPTTSRCGSARSSAARPSTRGARRLPAHAVQAPRARPDRGAARPLGRAGHPRRRRRRPARRPRVPLGAAGLRRMGHADRAGQLAAGRGAAPEAPVPHWGWGEAPPYQPG